MDIHQAFSVVTEKIKKLEPPDRATRIVGYLLLYYGEEEMIRLAHYPDQTIENAVQLVKNKFPLLAGNFPSPPVSPELRLFGEIMPVFNSFSPPGFPSTVAPIPNRDALVLPDDLLTEIQNKTPYFDLLDGYDHGVGRLRNFPVEEERRPDIVSKPCYYFSTGSCKRGYSCRFLHELPSPKRLTRVFDEDVLLPGSPKRLELEIIQLLRMNRGEPIQIGSLPELYYAMYGKALQANGYHTERQRFGLVKLLSRMKSSIHIIDRRNEQPSIILAEDARRHFEHRSGRNSPGCKQIYLTFPKESTFTEDDVAQYFSKFGKVEDVRIPNHSQPERMFGFVTFSNSDTVDELLSMRIHHVVGETEVYVKPYQEQPKVSDRRNMKPLGLHPREYVDTDSEFISTPRRRADAARLLRREQNMEQYNERPHHVNFQLARDSTGHRDHIPDSSNTLFPTDDATNDYSTIVDIPQEIYLPDSLTSSPVSNSMTATATPADPNQQGQGQPYMREL